LESVLKPVRPPKVFAQLSPESAFLPPCAIFHFLA